MSFCLIVLSSCKKKKKPKPELDLIKKPTVQNYPPIVSNTMDYYGITPKPSQHHQFIIVIIILASATTILLLEIYKENTTSK